MTKQKLLDYINSSSNLGKESTVELEVLVNKYPYFNIARIIYLQNLILLKDERSEKLLSLTSAFTTDRARLKEILEQPYIFQKNNNKQIAENGNIKNKSVNELIDKFISEEPSISKPAENKETDIEIPEQNENNIFDIATETLAKIYLKQANKEMALKIYNELILKFPEKSSYFAAQIEKIKRKS